VDCVAIARNVDAARNSDHAKTIAKTEDFVESNLRRRLRKSENIAEV